MVKVFLGLGSNKGDRLKFLTDAVNELEKNPDINIIKSSSIYETEPWGNKTLSKFLNSVIEIETELKPLELLKELKQVEKELGRVNNEEWTDREIDIDILFYGSDIVHNQALDIPHSEVENRKFVLVPLKEIAPDFIHPVINKSIMELLEITGDDSKVNKCNYTFA